jgi:peptidoglycan/LPS O-acetylase OafA/YrhL
LGVDVFFVISGFVITSTLLREIEESFSINLLRFYRRRIGRLLPALLLMILIVLPLSSLILDPYNEVPQTSKTALAGLLFSANAHLFAMSSYENLIESPLRHLWSLGVEEHFYIVFPGVVAAVVSVARSTGRATRKLILISLSAGFSVSLLASAVFSYRVGVSSLNWDGWVPFSWASIGFHSDWISRFSFFGSPLRFWEILAGALVACRAKPPPRPLLARVGFVTLIVIGGVAHYPDSSPGLLGALVVLVASLTVMWGNEASEVGVGALSLVKYLGDISYALYLWHWPLLVLMTRALGGQVVVRLGALLIALLAAIASTRFMESGFTQAHWRLWPLIPGALAVCVLSLLAARVGSFEGVRQRVPSPESKWENFATRNSCDAGQEGWQQVCTFVFPQKHTGTATVYLFGDSNARAASDGVAEAVRTIGGRLTIGVMRGCPFVAGSPGPELSSDCSILNQERYKLLRSKPPDVLIIVNHGTNYLKPQYPGFNSIADQVATTRRTLEIVRDLGVPILFQMQVPSCGGAPSVLQPRWRCATSATTERDRQELLRDLTLGKVVPQPGVYGLDLTARICQRDEHCRDLRDGVSIFSDATHLSPSFSRELGPLYERGLKTVLQAD